MKIYSIAIAGAAVLLAGSITSKAQTANDFFLDNYAFKYRFNPAMPSEKSFFSVGAGAVDLGLDSNIGLSSFLFPTESGTLVTGLHPDISADEFIGGLPDIAGMTVRANENIFAIGSWASKGFTSFEVNLRADADFNLPKGFFEFAKQGGGVRPFDLSDLGIAANAYLELAFGRTRAITDALNIGFRVKGLIGVGSVGLVAPKLSLTATQTTLAAEAEAQLQGALKGLELSVNEDGNYSLDSDISFDGDNIGPAGFGAAIDLGATYQLGHFTFSAAITDLGFMRWNYNIVGAGNGNFSFNGLEDLDMDSDMESQTEILTDALDDLTKVLEFSPKDAFSKMSRLNMTANAGVRYTPFNLLSLGVTGLVKTGISGSYIDARAGATLNPLPFISLSGNIGRNSYGSVFGAAASINLLFLNLYASVDSYLGNVMPDYYVPVDPFCLNGKFGLMFVFGKRHTEFK